MPSAMKKARGTYRRDRTAANEMTPPVMTPGMPEWLDEEARAEWLRVAPMLEGLGVLAEADRAALAAYCAAQSLAVQATRQYQREGLMPKPKKGSKMARVHLMVKVAQEARAQALRIGAEFGLTPAARTRVSAPPPKEKGDETEEFLFNKPRLVTSET